jgi:hypothetical protein
MQYVLAASMAESEHTGENQEEELKASLDLSKTNIKEASRHFIERYFLFFFTNVFLSFTCDNKNNIRMKGQK